MIDTILKGYPDDEFVKADGFDDAVIGLDTQDLRLVYSVKKALEILVTVQGFGEDEAREWFDHHISGSSNGEDFPIWCEDDFD